MTAVRSVALRPLVKPTTSAVVVTKANARSLASGDHDHHDYGANLGTPFVVWLALIVIH